MISDTTPFGASRLRGPALKHAETLASKTGEAAVIYYRPIDGRWFVRRATANAPRGLTIKTTVYPQKGCSGRPDTPEHPLDGPAAADVHI